MVEPVVVIWQDSAAAVALVVWRSNKWLLEKLLVTSALERELQIEIKKFKKIGHKSKNCWSHNVPLSQGFGTPNEYVWLI